MRAIIDDPLADQRMMVEEWCGAIADEEVNGRVRKCAVKILEECRRQYHVAKASQLHDQDLTRVRNAGRLHSGSRHSFAYCTKA